MPTPGGEGVRKRERESKARLKTVPVNGTNEFTGLSNHPGNLFNLFQLRSIGFGRVLLRLLHRSPPSSTWSSPAQECYCETTKRRIGDIPQLIGPYKKLMTVTHIRTRNRLNYFQISDSSVEVQRNENIRTELLKYP